MYLQHHPVSSTVWPRSETIRTHPNDTQSMTSFQPLLFAFESESMGAFGNRTLSDLSGFFLKLMR
jgi:hypothetical protein